MIPHAEAERLARSERAAAGATDRGRAEGRRAALAAEVLALATDRAVPIVLGRLLPVPAYAAAGLLLPLLAFLDLAVRALLQHGLPAAVALGAVRRVTVRGQLACAALAALGLAAVAGRLAAGFGALVPAAEVRLGAVFLLAVAGLTLAVDRVERLGARREQAATAVVAVVCRAVLLAAFLAQGLGLGGVVGAYALSALAATAFAASAAPRRGPGAPPPAAAPDVAGAATRGVLWLLRQLDVLLLARLGQNAAWSGVYAAASMLVKPPTLRPARSTPLALDALAGLAAVDRARAGALVSGWVQAIVVVLVPAAVLLHALAADLLGALFGARYLDVASALAALGLGLPLFALHTLLSHCLVAVGRSGIAATLNLALVPLELLLVNQWSTVGFLGFATGVVATAGLGTLLTGLCLVHDGYLTPPRWTGLARVLGVSLACAYVPQWAGLLEEAPLLRGGLAYLAALVVLSATGDLDPRRLRSAPAPGA